jgi:3-deoxy-D-manno-octulosonic-acid transferase
VAASTHAGAEEQVLTAFHSLRETLPNLLLVLVPRHPERFDRVVEMSITWCQQRGWQCMRSSNHQEADELTAIIVGDTLGELRMFYAAADIAFVGGSLVPVGGHNILEPAVAGLPVICGPHMHNFTEAADMLLTGKAMIQVEDAHQLAEAVLRFAQDPRQRLASGQRGQEIVASNRGALQRTVDALTPFLQ